MKDKFTASREEAKGAWDERIEKSTENNSTSFKEPKKP